MIEKIRRTKAPKCIKTYSRIADKEHKCYLCDEPINPGDKYHGEIFVGKVDGRKYFSVYKHHEFCPGKRYDEDDEEEERVREMMSVSEPEIAKAA